MTLLAHFNHQIVIVLMCLGIYVIMARDNLVKKILGLNVFQAAVILLYVTMGKVDGGTAAILVEGEGDVVYSNPVPHVLMLTAIVVGVATTAVGLALVVRIQEAFGTIEDAELQRMEEEQDA